MTDEIRAEIRKRISATGRSQAEIARAMGLLPQNLNKALQTQGLIPPVWQKILEFFDLELVLLPKKHSEETEQDSKNGD